MIDFAKIVARVQARIQELGTTAAEVSAKATDSKDTIRNWIRALEADPEKASATILKINQVEEALGIELARNVTEAPQSPEDRLRSALLAFGVDKEELGRAVSAVKVFVDDLDEQSSQGPLEDQSAPSSRRHGSTPSGKRPRQPAS